MAEYCNTKTRKYENDVEKRNPGLCRFYTLKKQINTKYYFHGQGTGFFLFCGER